MLLARSFSFIRILKKVCFNHLLYSPDTHNFTGSLTTFQRLDFLSLRLKIQSMAAHPGTHIKDPTTAQRERMGFQLWEILRPTKEQFHRHDLGASVIIV